MKLRHALMMAVGTALAAIAGVHDPAMAQERKITGVVMDLGEALADAQVAIYKRQVNEQRISSPPPPYGTPPTDAFATYTDDQGRFELAWPEDAELVWLRWRDADGNTAKRYLTAPTEVELVLREPPPAPPEPPKPKTLHGRVIGLNLQPISGAYVQIYGWKTAGGEEQFFNPVPEYARTYTAEDGTFELQAPGEASLVMISAYTEELGTQSVTSGTRSETLRDIRLYKSRPPQKIFASGTVVDGEGNPVEGAKVTIFRPAGPRHGETDADGTFYIELPKAGHVVVRVEKEGVGFYATHKWSGKDRSRHPTHDMQIALRKPGVITGTVRDADSGAPIPHVKLAIEPCYFMHAQADISPTVDYMRVLAGQRFPREVRTDAEGRYRLQVDAGPAEMHLRRWGYMTTESRRGSSVSIPDGGEVTRDFTMKRLYTAAIRLLKDGQPLNHSDVGYEVEPDIMSHSFMPDGSAPVPWHVMFAVEQEGAVLRLIPERSTRGMVIEPNEIPMTLDDTVTDVHVREQ